MAEVCWGRSLFGFQMQEHPPCLKHLGRRCKVTVHLGSLGRHPHSVYLVIEPRHQDVPQHKTYSNLLRRLLPDERKKKSVIPLLLNYRDLQGFRPHLFHYDHVQLLEVSRGERKVALPWKMAPAFPCSFINTGRSMFLTEWILLRLAQEASRHFQHGTASQTRVGRELFRWRFCSQSIFSRADTQYFVCQSLVVPLLGQRCSLLYGFASAIIVEMTLSPFSNF